MIASSLLAGVGYFWFVFLKAFQQRNVAFLHWGLIGPTSYAMAISEVLVVSVVAVRAVDGGTFTDYAVLAVSIGTGSWLGCVCAMRLHVWLKGT